MYHFSGKAALVTGVGGKGGIGRAIANRLAHDGADVAVTDLSPIGSKAVADGWHGAASAAEEIAAMGRRSFATFGDISDAATVDRLVEETICRVWMHRHLCSQRCLHSGPGSRADDRSPRGGFRSRPTRQCKGNLLMLPGSSPTYGGARRRWTHRHHIVEHGQAGSAAFRRYSALKFAVNGLTQCLAHELGSEGITVNAVCPGSLETERLANIAEGMREGNETAEDWLNKARASAIASTALGRLGTVGDVASLVAFLASDEAGFLTGLSISVSGGAVMI